MDLCLAVSSANVPTGRTADALPASAATALAGVPVRVDGVLAHRWGRAAAQLDRSKPCFSRASPNEVRWA